MKRAVFTKYCGPTVKFAPRILVKAWGLPTQYVYWDDNLTEEDNHRTATAAFAKKYGWPEQFVTGRNHIGCVHVFLDKNEVLISRVGYEILMANMPKED